MCRLVMSRACCHSRLLCGAENRIGAVQAGLLVARVARRLGVGVLIDVRQPQLLCPSSSATTRSRSFSRASLLCRSPTLPLSTSHHHPGARIRLLIRQQRWSHCGGMESLCRIGVQMHGRSWIATLVLRLWHLGLPIRNCRSAWGRGRSLICV